MRKAGFDSNHLISRIKQKIYWIGKSKSLVNSRVELFISWLNAHILLFFRKKAVEKGGKAEEKGGKERL